MGAARCGTIVNEKPEMQRRRGHRAAVHTVVAVLSLITVHGGNRSGGLE